MSGTPLSSPFARRASGDTFPDKGGRKNKAALLPPLRGKLAATRERRGLKGGIVATSCAALPPLESGTLGRYQVVGPGSLPAREFSPGGEGGADYAENNYIAEAGVTPWNQKERRND